MSTGRLGAGDTAIQPTIFDAKGDLLTATAGDTPARIAVGSNGQYLKADSTTATGLAWATLPSSGKVLQVVTGTTTTNFTTSSTTYGDTNLSATITPSATSSKVLVLVSQQFYMYRAASEMGFGLRILRGATAIHTAADIGYIQTTSGTRGDLKGFAAMIYVDSPSTTSATTYKTQGNVTYTTNSAGVSIQDGAAVSTITLLEIGA